MVNWEERTYFLKLQVDLDTFLHAGDPTACQLAQ
jgi:hypothetical protein